MVADRLDPARGRLPGGRDRDGVPDRDARSGTRSTAPEPRELYVIAALVLAVGLARALFMSGRRLISGRQALGVEFDMRNALYAKLLRLSFGFYDRHQTGQLLSRATVDLQTVRFFLGYGLVFLFQNVLTIVAATAIMFIVNWRLALVATAVTPLIVIIAYRYSSVAHPVLRDVQQKMADVATVAEENIVGVHVVKSFAQERNELDKFSDRTERVFDRSIDANKQRALYVPLLSFLPLIMQAGVLLVGGRMVANGTLDFGSFFFFNILVVMLVMPLRMLGMWVGQSQRATASGERIFEVMDEPEEIAEKPDATELPPGDGRVRYEHVTFEYAPGRPVLHDIDLELEPGPDGRADRAHRLGQDDARLAGPALLRRDRRAGVTIDGVDVRDVKLHVAAARDRRSSPRTRSSSRRPCARTSRSASPDATDEEVERAARLAQAHEFIERAPGRLRDGDRRARDHALAAASASGSRSRARSSWSRGS